jgi:hypothetical protein
VSSHTNRGRSYDCPGNPQKLLEPEYDIDGRSALLVFLSAAGHVAVILKAFLSVAYNDLSYIHQNC